jgi:hypothetical protein
MTAAHINTPGTTRIGNLHHGPTVERSHRDHVAVGMTSTLMSEAVGNAVGAVDGAVSGW